MDEAFRLAAAPHRGPVFVDVALEALFGQAGPRLAATAGPAGRRGPAGPAGRTRRDQPDRRAARGGPAAGAGARLGRVDGPRRGRRPGRGRGTPAAGHRQRAGPRHPAGRVIRCWSPGPGRSRFRQADLVVVAGHSAGLPARLRAFGDQDDRTQPAVVHVADAPGQLATHCELAASARPVTSARSSRRWPGRPPGRPGRPGCPGRTPGSPGCRTRRAAAMAADGALLASDADPIHPMRIYGELARVLDDDAVVIGDGGDFVSYAGKYMEPGRPGGWLDPGPYGCLGTGLGYAIAARIARPSAQVVLLLGDGAAGFSLMDADTLVRHGLPVVMICGNNGDLGAGEAPHAGAVRLRRGRRPAAADAATTRWSAPWAAPGNWSPSRTGSARRCGGPSPRASRTWSTSSPTRTVAYPRSTTGV